MIHAPTNNWYNIHKERGHGYETINRLEKDEGFELTDALEIHFMELPKFLVKWREGLVTPWEDMLVRWLFLSEGSTDQEILRILEEVAMQDPILNRAMREWENSSDDPKIREEYFARQKAIQDEKAKVREAELRVREALEKGRAEGEEKGIAKVAIKLLEAGMEISKVSELTGLSQEDVRKLR